MNLYNEMFYDIFVVYA